MTEDSVKATRATIRIGSIEVDGFMLPDGSYRMSQTQAAECVGKPEIYARRFLGSTDIKALLGKGYTDYTPESIEVEPEPGTRGQARINATPLEIVSPYWLTRAYKEYGYHLTVESYKDPLQTTAQRGSIVNLVSFYYRSGGKWML